MAATMKKAAAEDVNVTFEDQQKINKFARNTSRITELKEEIEVKKKQLQNLEDACEDIMLADDDCLMIPYQIGDVFISHSQEETQEMLEEAKKNLQEEIDALEARVESIQRVLADLKVQLYAKFGSNINLEADDIAVWRWQKHFRKTPSGVPGWLSGLKPLPLKPPAEMTASLEALKGKGGSF
ncbi:prefoldin subunit 4 [Lontra canadensis]|uniref:prefoldin subunit 4 n=1 Tax=Lontra canadensis TaxID=76717 RepID=UPI0013F3330E|nr:prefoldin subunit 4 [Lontra canadensis]